MPASRCRIRSLQQPLPHAQAVLRLPQSWAPGKNLDPAVDEFMHLLLAKEGQDAVADMGLFPGPWNS